MTEDHATESASTAGPEDAPHLTREEWEEIDLFQQQERFRVEKNARRHALEMKQMRERFAFERAEENREGELVRAMGRRIKNDGIDATRKHVVPAYTFTRFRELPTEIRWRIWSFAACFEKPRIHQLTSPIPSTDKGILMMGCRVRTHGSSYVSPASGSYPDSVSVVLHVCQESRMVAQRIHTLLPCEKYGQPRYFNNLHDEFYIGGEPSWTRFQVLVDMFIRLNSSRSLPGRARLDVEKLSEIRNLRVDLNVFASMPIHFWAGFTKLEKLTLVLYSYNEFGEHEDVSFDSHPDFVRVKQRSKHGGRAEWVLNYVREAFHTAKNDLPQWTIPQLDVLHRFAELPNDFELELADDQYNTESDAEEGEYDDSGWYREAGARMIHNVSRNEIRRLKIMHHPSLKITHFNRHFHDGKESGQYLTDSETEDLDGFDDYDF